MMSVLTWQGKRFHAAQRHKREQARSGKATPKAAAGELVGRQKPKSRGWPDSLLITLLAGPVGAPRSSEIWKSLGCSASSRSSAASRCPRMCGMSLPAASVSNKGR